MEKSSLGSLNLPKILNVKKIRLLTSVIYGNKRLKHAFKDFKDDMKEQFEIECEIGFEVEFEMVIEL